MAIPARPIDPTRDRDRRLAESRAAYGENAYQFRDRRLGESRSPWVRSFACDEMKVLIVCRGPIRKEAIDVFRRTISPGVVREDIPPAMTYRWKNNQAMESVS